MTNPNSFISTLETEGIDFFTGVPDSLLKNFCACIADTRTDRHVTAANEGGAIALASGHYLATGRPALVYMQNSGQGNAVNPMVSLADPDVYSIPMVLLVGWRGEPGVKDEPQHIKQGKITISLFETIGVPVSVLPDGEDDALRAAAAAVRHAVAESRPVALVARKGCFADVTLQSRKPDLSPLRREDAIEAILWSIGDKAVVVSTTGMISREVYETRERLGQRHGRDFLTVGSMGHASMIALGIARECNAVDPNRYVVCLDGDGAAIMHMGSLAITGAAHQANLIHVVLNNAAHDSVGGQPTVADRIDLTGVAKACGYYAPEPFSGGTAEELRKWFGKIRDRAIYSWACDRPEYRQTTFVEVKVAKGARKDLGRPKEAPIVNKRSFMETLSSKPENFK